MNVDVVDASGKRVPINRLMLHHIVFTNIGRSLEDKRHPTCPQGIESWNTLDKIPPLGEPFYAAGEERARMQLPDGYGYPISKQETWLMTYMFMNHRSVTDRAYVEYNMTVDTRPDVTRVEPYWLDVENCKIDPVYDVPGGGRKGSVHKRKMVWTVPKTGRLVAGRRPRSRRRQGAQAAQAGLPEQLDLHVAADLGRQEPSLLQGQAGAARAGSDQHDRVLLRARRAARAG